MFASAPVIKDGKTVGVVDVGTALENSYFEPLAKKLGANVAVHVFKDGAFEKQASTFSGDTVLTDPSNSRPPMTATGERPGQDR